MFIAARLGGTRPRHRYRHRATVPTDMRWSYEPTNCLGGIDATDDAEIKIHRATVTRTDLHVGSVTGDADLMDAADLLDGEQVTIVDVDNGARRHLCDHRRRGSGVIGINGAAAHRPSG
jgi:hypothetical protein